jgi:hypothetical protein
MEGCIGMSKKKPPSGNSRPNNRKLKAKHPYTDLSDRVCEVAGCRKQIKTRLVLLLDAKVCYWHHKSSKKKVGVRP